MGRRRAAKRHKSSSSHGDKEASDTLIREELSGDEMLDEIDRFEAAESSRQLKWMNASDDQFSGRNCRSVYEFEDSSCDDDDAVDTTANTELVTSCDDGEEEGQGGDDGRSDSDEDGIDVTDKRWGRTRHSYYDGETVDGNWRRAPTEQQIEMMQLEARETRMLQEKLVAELDEDIYDLDGAVCGELTDDVKSETVDCSRLGEMRDAVSRVQLCDKFPVVTVLISEFSKYARYLIDVITPCVEQINKRDAVDKEVQTERFDRIHRNDVTLRFPCILQLLFIKRSLIVTYCMNISFYLALCSRAISDRKHDISTVKKHPVLRRISQMAKLLRTLSEFDEHIKLIHANAVSGNITRDTLKFTPLSSALPSCHAHEQAFSAGTRSDQEDEEEDDEMDEIDSATVSTRQLAEADRSQVDAAGGGDMIDADVRREKRRITYEIAKNKGLMPQRKKENRNARVKHRNRYARALKKHRTMVRQAKPELQKYAGEFRGIRKASIRSTPFK